MTTHTAVILIVDWLKDAQSYLCEVTSGWFLLITEYCSIFTYYHVMSYEKSQNKSLSFLYIHAAATSKSLSTDVTDTSAGVILFVSIKATCGFAVAAAS